MMHTHHLMHREPSCSDEPLQFLYELASNGGTAFRKSCSSSAARGVIHHERGRLAFRAYCACLVPGGLRHRLEDERGHAVSLYGVCLKGTALADRGLADAVFRTVSVVMPAPPRVPALLMWVVAYFSQTLIIFNSILGANRYLAVRDGRCAQKAANLAAALFLVGPVIWFIPPLAASFVFPDIDAMLPALQHANYGANVLMALHMLPAGLAGLLVMAIFAATLFSMHNTINVNAGILSMNVYKPLFRPHTSERELFIASRVFNVLSRVAVVCGAYTLSKHNGMNLFDLMLLMLTGIGLPLAVPCLLLFIFRQTPPWTAVASVAAAGIYSFYAVRADLHLSRRVFGIIGRLLWKSTAAGQREKIEKFYRRMETPVDATKEIVGSEDVRHLSLVGLLAMLVGAGLLLAAVFPNPLGARIIIALTALMIFSVGFTMHWIGGPPKSGATR